MRKLTGLIPWLRARRTGWSVESDRAYHDTLFASHDHDAFSPSYTGNITIRRFADLADPFVDGCATDWLAADLEKIRSRIAYTVAEGSPTASSSSHARHETGGADADRDFDDDSDRDGEPVENRYSVETLAKLFAGYGLRFRGTVSGLDEYPPQPTLDTATRREFGEVTYQLYRSVDERLYESGLDLHAKHLVIYAEAGAESEHRMPARDLPGTGNASETRGAYDVEYLGYEGPERGPAGTAFDARVRLRNRSFRVYSSDDVAHPDLVSYHWLDTDHRSVAEGTRSRLPRSVLPGETVDVAVRVTTPAETGDYILAVDPVQEGKTWFRLWTRIPANDPVSDLDTRHQQVLRVWCHAVEVLLRHDRAAMQHQKAVGRCTDGVVGPRGAVPCRPRRAAR